VTRSRIRALAALACVFLAGSMSAHCTAGEPSTLGDRVLAFCKEHKGKRVGNGECTSLIVAALQAAGGQTHGLRHSDAADEPADGLNWGERVFVLERQAGPFKTTGRIQDVRPGDIIQFRDTLLSGPDGNFGNYTMRSHRHTAVVAQLDDGGTALKIYHQNSNGYKKVTARWIQLTDLQQGRFDIYRPIARTRRPSHDKPADNLTAPEEAR
jgi:hypothetical protein